MASGWCESCGKKIPGSLIAASHPTRKRAFREVQENLPVAMHRRDSMSGLLIGAVVAVLVFAVVWWLMRAAGYPYIILVGVAILAAGLSIGQMADGMMSGKRK
jgi:hypothetical protein